MSVYMTEEEQIEAIKKWWKRYNGIITVVLSILLFIFAVFKYWHVHQEKIKNQASGTYEQLMGAVSNHDAKSIQAYSNQLVSNFKHTVYADAAHLILAKLFIDEAKYQEAQKELEQVVTKSKVISLKQVAKIRLARLLIMQKFYDKALQELSTLDDTAYSAVVDEIKGDIYLAMGRTKDANEAYKKANETIREKGVANSFLEMKTNELEETL